MNIVSIKPQEQQQQKKGIQEMRTKGNVRLMGKGSHRKTSVFQSSRVRNDRKMTYFLMFECTERALLCSEKV